MGTCVWSEVRGLRFVPQCTCSTLKAGSSEQELPLVSYRGYIVLYSTLGGRESTDDIW